MAKARIRTAYPAPGRLIDIGGYRLHLDCRGSGGPAVIMDAGLGEFSPMWALVQPEVATSTQACAYDRAGLGWSDPSPRPRTAGVAVDELHTLLARSGVRAPYVLVGHSFGGLIARMYAHKYPRDVVGLVILDSSHEEQPLREPEEFQAMARRRGVQVQREVWLAGVLASVGVLSLYPAVFPVHPNLPHDVARAYRAIVVSGPHLRAMLAEMRWGDESLAQARAARMVSLGTIPIRVLSRDRPDPWPPGMRISAGVLAEEERVWRQLLAREAAVSTNGRLVIAAGSAHYVHLDRPDLVISAIRDVLPVPW